ncbi:hypothetical protein BHE74_00029378 [Ensete ventricosum]|nr:hypothetical protein BHE74_00029378 [Ensete ventricosum]
MALRGALLLSAPGVSFDGAANREYDHLSKRRDPRTNMSRQEVVEVAVGIVLGMMCPNKGLPRWLPTWSSGTYTAFVSLT